MSAARQYYVRRCRVAQCVVTPNRAQRRRYVRSRRGNVGRPTRSMVFCWREKACGRIGGRPRGESNKVSVGRRDANEQVALPLRCAPGHQGKCRHQGRQEIASNACEIPGRGSRRTPGGGRWKVKAGARGCVVRRFWVVVRVQHASKVCWLRGNTVKVAQHVKVQPSSRLLYCSVVAVRTHVQRAYGGGVGRQACVAARKP